MPTVVNMTRPVGPSVAGVLIGVPFIGLTGVFLIVGLCCIHVMVTVARTSG